MSIAAVGQSSSQFTVSPHMVLSPQLEAKSNISKIKQGDRAQQKHAIYGLHSYGKEAIPLLIESLDDSTRFDNAELLNPMSSFIPPDSLKPSFKGVLFAYTIELILGKESLKGDPREASFLVDADDCVYHYGLLKKDGAILKRKDLALLKATYARWWEEHKELSLEELRRLWTERKRPLTGSGFTWN